MNQITRFKDFNIIANYFNIIKNKMINNIRIIIKFIKKKYNLNILGE